MVMWILFFISISILVLLVFFRIRNHQKQNLLNDSTTTIARQKLEELYQHGKQIRQHAAEYNVPKHNTISQKAVQPQRKEQLPSSLITLIETALNILVGKYHLSPDAETHVAFKLDEMFEQMLPTIKISSIISKYDPAHSNDLLLHSSRFLMDYENLSPNTRLRVAQFIINTTLDGEELGRIYDWIIELGSDTTVSHQVRQEAVDMLILSNSSRYRKISRQILESLRQEDDIRIEEPENFPEERRENVNPFVVVNPVERRRTIRIGGTEYDIDAQIALLNQFQHTKPKVERTVYQDGQSVHNNEINKSVLQAAKFLQTQYPAKTRLNFDTSLLNNLSSAQREKAELSLHRIGTDDATFGANITLSNLFQSLQSFIHSSPDKDELNKRLVQELEDMSGTCASGHMSRLVNVMQGFNTVPQQSIRIKLGDEIYATVNHTLTQALSKTENQEISEAIIMGEKQKLVNNFVAQKLNSIFPEMQKAYQNTAKDSEIMQELLIAAKKYTKDEHFALQQNKLITS